MQLDCTSQMAASWLLYAQLGWLKQVESGWLHCFLLWPFQMGNQTSYTMAGLSQSRHSKTPRWKPKGSLRPVLRNYTASWLLFSIGQKWVTGQPRFKRGPHKTRIPGGVVHWGLALRLTTTVGPLAPHTFKIHSPSKTPKVSSGKSSDLGSKSRTSISTSGLVLRRPVREWALGDGFSWFQDMWTRETSYLPPKPQWPRPPGIYALCGPPTLNPGWPGMHANTWVTGDICCISFGHSL